MKNVWIEFFYPVSKSTSKHQRVAHIVQIQRYKQIENCLKGILSLWLFSISGLAPLSIWKFFFFFSQKIQIILVVCVCVARSGRKYKPGHQKQSCKHDEKKNT